jgi:hypothetical protein
MEKTEQKMGKTEQKMGKTKQKIGENKTEQKKRFKFLNFKFFTLFHFN